MDIEFHYYITQIIALRAGFHPQESYTIAYSCQYTDDNTSVFEVKDGNNPAYGNYISQTNDILKPEKKFFMRIYPIFHFFPGPPEDVTCDSARRRDGKLHLLDTTQDNKNVRELLRQAFQSRNLYRIGIATHTFSDTFAHQNFVGYYDAFNSMEGLLAKALPNIGHAEARHQPDLPALTWKDSRLVQAHEKIVNRKRFLETAERLFAEYCAYLNRPLTRAEQSDLIKDLDTAIGEEDDESNRFREDRINRYKKLIGSGLIEYDENKWFKDAVKRNIGFFKWNYSWRHNSYQNSDWYKFQEAVKEHQNLAKNGILKPIFDRMDLANL